MARLVPVEGNPFSAPAPAAPSAPATPSARRLVPVEGNPFAAAPQARRPIHSAIEQVESGGREDAVSPKGAYGPMQVMPSTAADPGFGLKPLTPEQLKDPAANRKFGADYFDAMVERYGGDVDKALAAYNAGPGNVDRAIDRHGDGYLSGLPPETQAYVPKVRGLVPPPPPPLATNQSEPRIEMSPAWAAAPAAAPVVVPPAPDTAPRAPAPQAANDDGPGAISRGFVSGLLDQNPTMTAEALEGLSYLSPEQFRDTFATASRDMRGLSTLSPEQYAPRARSLWESQGIGDALTWAGEALGQGVASTVPSIVTGVTGAAIGSRVGGKLGGTVGAIGGAAVPSAALNYGELYRALKDEGVAPPAAAEWALAGAGPMVALDTLSIGPIVQRLGGMQEVKRQIARGIARRIAAEAAKGAGREGLTEAAQEAVKEATVSIAADKPFWTAENLAGIVESGIAGGLTGGALGGGAGIVPDAVPAQAPQVRQEPTIAPPGVVPPQAEQAPVLPEGAINAETVIGATPEPAPEPPPPYTAGALKTLIQDDRPVEEIQAEREAEQQAAADAAAQEQAAAEEAVRQEQAAAEEAVRQQQAAAEEAVRQQQAAAEAVQRQAQEAETAAAQQQEIAAVEAARADADTVELANGDRVPVVRDGGDAFIRSGERFVQVFPEDGGSYHRVGSVYAPSIAEVRDRTRQAAQNRSEPMTEADTFRSDPEMALSALDNTALAAVAKQLGIRAGGRPKGALIEAVMGKGAAAARDAYLAIQQPAQQQAPTPPDPALIARISDYVDGKGSLATASIAKALGVDESTAARALATYAARAGSRVRQVKGGRYARIPRTGPVDLLQFIASRGGIADPGGNLKAMDAQRRFLPGYGRFVRPSGRNQDDVALEAWGAGYIGRPDERPDINTLLDAIDRSLRGERIFAAADMNAVADTEEARRAADEETEIKEAVAAIAEIEAGLSIKFSPEERDAALRMIVVDGMDPVDAVDEALERSALVSEGRHANMAPQETGDEATTESVDAGAAGRAREEPPGDRGDEGRARRRADERPPAGDGDGPDQRATGTEDGTRRQVVPDDFDDIPFARDQPAEPARRRPDGNPAADTILTDLRAELDRLGLTTVRLATPEQIDGGNANGMYWRRVISVALDTVDKTATLHHESIHAMYRLGLFRPAEWRALEAEARRTWTDRYRIRERYGDLNLSEDQIAEEAIASAFSDYMAGRYQPKGMIGRAFALLRRALEAIRGAFGRAGYPTWEAVFEAAGEGRVGRRGRGGARVEPRFSPAFAAAWHGTPHEVDRFSTEKIGTGEGAQAYGWGLYFASQREVADVYRRALAGARKVPPEVLDILRKVDLLGFDTAGAAMSAIRADADWVRTFDAGELTEAELAAVNDYAKQPFGRLYRVNLAPAEDEYLLWDEPLSAQSEKVKAAVAAAASEFRPGFQVDAQRTGGAIYMDLFLMNKTGAETDRMRAASEALARAGIPGIKYLDQFSRSDGDGSYNYVIFDDSLIEIEEAFSRRGQPAPGPEQTAIPGTEPATPEQLRRRTGQQQREEAEARMKGRQTAKKPQADADDLPLFGGARQGRLFERREPAGPTDPTFNREPRTTSERQSVMWRLLANKQPIDRALRVPFQIFGGIDKFGRWKPGLKLSDGAGRIITQAKFTPASRFSFVNPLLEQARRGLVDRYGLDPDYVRRDRARELDERAIAARGLEFLNALKESGMNAEEARVLQAVLTGEAVPDAAWAKTAAPIRQAIDELGAEAVELGLVSRESYERNRGTYLHRVYAKHEAAASGLTRWVAEQFGRRRRKIVGNQFKGRGIFLDVPVSRITADDPEFWQARTGGPVRGQKFLVLDRVEGSRDLVDPEATPEQVVQRVFWPADRRVPDRYRGDDWRRNGTWEVRGIRGGKATIWRDYSKVERERMGEMLDARYTIGKTFMLMASDLATGRFFRDIAMNESWSRKDPPNSRWVDAAEYNRFWADPEIAWVRVPETEIPDSGGKKRYGGLAGRYVRAEIWRDIAETEQMMKPGVWKALLTQWKLNKTARSPVVHMNNVMSNLVFMDMADISFGDLVEGITAYAKGAKAYTEARDAGAFGADMVTQEIRKQVLEPVLEEIRKQAAAPGPQASAKLAALTALSGRIWERGKALDQKMIDLYRLEDEVFRMAMFVRRRRQGATTQEAADQAREQFLDYDIKAPWVNAARRSVLPFLSYVYRAAPVIAKSMASHPWKLPKYFLVAYMANALAYMIDDDGDEDYERRSLRDDERGSTWIGMPRMIRMPWRDRNGNPVFLDVRRWIPAGDIFDMGQGSSSFPIPAPLLFGGPVMLAAEMMLNKSAFTGREITNDRTDDLWDMTGKIGDYLWKAWMPSAAWVPGSWYWTKIENALRGATDRSGTPYSVPDAVLSSVGVKMKPQDVDQNMADRAYEFSRIERDLRAEARRLSRGLERGFVSQQAFDRAMAKLIRKMENLGERAQERLRGPGEPAATGTTP